MIFDSQMRLKVAHQNLLHSIHSYFQFQMWPFDELLEWLRSLFWKQEMELTLVGLQNSGKTTIVNVLANGQYQEDMIPTVGFNMRKVTKGSVVMKLWDLGGQARFRSMWERYCRGVSAIASLLFNSIGFRS